MSEMLFVPLHGISGSSSEQIFYFTFLMLNIPMFAAMFGVFLLKRIGISARLTGSAWWLYPLLYVSLPVGVLLHEVMYTPTDSMIIEEYALFFVLFVLPLLGFLQVSFTDPERNGIYFVALVTTLLSLWYMAQLSISVVDAPYLEILSLFSLAIYLLLLVYATGTTQEVVEESNYKRLFIPVVFLTVIFFPVLMVLLLVGSGLA